VAVIDDPRSGRDIGIDLVAEDRDGGIWAIHGRQHDLACSINKADLDSFSSASSRPEFSYRPLIATSDQLGPAQPRSQTRM
jgi:predicted helicase